MVLSPEGDYRAERLGYVCLEGTQLSVLSPLWIDSDNMHVYWFVLDEQTQPVTPEMIQQCLVDLGVVEGIQEEKIKDLSFRLKQDKHECGGFLIAAGTKPQEGEDAQVELQVELERRAGQERPDGSIDFREVNFAPNVTAGQFVAQRIPATQGTPEKDVKGHVLEARNGEDQLLKAGENIQVSREDGGIEKFSVMIAGILRRRDDELSAVELLTLAEDVSFNTGNLDFNGEIYIDGSVVQGFSVKSEGDITISGTVEAGAAVISQGNISIGRGIVGRRTKVVARGSMRAQFVQEARVIAGEDILLGNYAYHAHLRAGSRISVSKGTGSRGGSIMGGQTWVRQGMDLHIAGTPAGIATFLVAGLEPDQAEQLDKLKRSIETAQEHILRILKKFVMTRIDLTQIRNMIAAATGPRRKILAHYARQLGQLAKMHQQKLNERKQLEEKIGTASENTEILVRDQAYAGVVVRMGEHQRKLADDLQASRFHLADGELVER